MTPTPEPAEPAEQAGDPRMPVVALLWRDDWGIQHSSLTALPDTYPHEPLVRLRDAQAALAAMQARAGAAEKDAARLQWMSDHCERESSIRLADNTFKACRAWAIAADGHDLRTAIDAASKQGAEHSAGETDGE